MTDSPRPSDLERDTFPDASGPLSADVAALAYLEEAMRDVVDPELMVNVVDLGLVYGIAVDEENNATIDMTLTSPTCPLTDRLEYDKEQLRKHYRNRGFYDFRVVSAIAELAPVVDSGAPMT